jgi:hypothetical protein
MDDLNAILQVTSKNISKRGFRNDRPDLRLLGKWENALASKSLSTKIDKITTRYSLIRSNTRYCQYIITENQLQSFSIQFCVGFCILYTKNRPEDQQTRPIFH